MTCTVRRAEAQIKRKITHFTGDIGLVLLHIISIKTFQKRQKWLVGVCFTRIM
jgi:hypothetical protein